MEVTIAVGAVVLLIATFWILNRQPHPEESEEGLGGPENAGPVGDPYPPGSAPAGPDAESQDPGPPSAGK